MKYFILVTIAFINFVMQADARPTADAISSNAGMENVSGHLSSAGASRDSRAPSVLAVDQTLFTTDMQSTSADSELVHRDDRALLPPGFLWIFGSMFAGAAALFCSRIFAAKNTR